MLLQKRLLVGRLAPGPLPKRGTLTAAECAALGLERAGFSHKALVERNPRVTATLAKNGHTNVTTADVGDVVNASSPRRHGTIRWSALLEAFAALPGAVLGHAGLQARLPHLLEDEGVRGGQPERRGHVGDAHSVHAPKFIWKVRRFLSFAAFARVKVSWPRRASGSTSVWEMLLRSRE